VKRMRNLSKREEFRKEENVEVEMYIQTSGDDRKRDEEVE
jgi:hypothetical protein